jgi:hypothetical protein
VRIESITLTEFLSCGDQVSTGKLADISVIVGQNNTGKSNVLKMFLWLRQCIPSIVNGGSIDVEERFLYQYSNDSKLSSPAGELVLSLTPADIDDACANINPNHRFYEERLRANLSKNIHLSFSTGPRMAGQKVGNVIIGDYPLEDIPTTGGRPAPPDRIGHLRELLSQWFGKAWNSKIVHLSGWRSLNENRSVGATITRSLHEWRSPMPAHRKQLDKFSEIEKLFCRMTGLEGAKLQTDSSGSDIIIVWRGRYLSIQSYGDGIQHLLMLAFELCTRHECIFLLEEIETHLHPEVQRRLLSILHEYPKNQFILTSHSPVMLDTRVPKLVIRCSHDGDKTTLSRCETTQGTYSVLDEIGARASDVLQANVVIWVEGPSDRLLLLKCVQILESNLVEGVHFQFAYYGGKLKSHLSVGEIDTDFVNILRLGRRVVFLCDSDKDDEHDAIDNTKQRLQNECELAGMLFLVTNGREIENLLPVPSVNALLHKLTGSQIDMRVGLFDQFGECLKQALGNVEHGLRWLLNYDQNKVKFMTSCVEHIDLERIKNTELEKMSNNVITYVRKHNS